MAEWLEACAVYILLSNGFVDF